MDQKMTSLELAQKKLLLASDSVIRKSDIETLLETTPQKIWAEAKKARRTVAGKEETGSVKFNKKLVKTWAVFQAAGLDRDEMIASLKSAVK